MHHDLTNVELLVIDNFGDDVLRDFINSWAYDKVRYVRYTDVQGTSMPRNKVFEEAQGEWVICIDSHVLLAPNAVSDLLKWIEDNNDSRDLIQGPMLYDDTKIVADSFSDVWACGMWGTWSINPNLPSEPFEIQMMGLGLFGCRKDAWLGFNDKFKGFGGEEGYIHQKYRNAGHKTLCLPFLKWLHYFHTRNGKVTCAYTPILSDRIHNYLIGFREVGLPVADVINHFNVPKGQVDSILRTSGYRLITNIQIDPNAVCGSKCWFCPVKFVDRPERTLMTIDVFTHILDEIIRAQRFGLVTQTFTLWLSSYNDILLDPLLENRLIELRRRGLGFTCLTNGVGLLKVVDLLHEYRDVIHGYSVNLPAGNAKDYERYTENQESVFYDILSGLHRLYSKDPEYYRHSVHVGINGRYPNDNVLFDVPPNDTDLQLHDLKLWLSEYPRVEAMRPLCDRAGHLKPFSIDNRANVSNPKGCNRLTEWLHFNSLGDLYTCCQDYLEETKYANILTSDLVSILNVDMPTELTKSSLCVKCIFNQP
jgi:glycosyltransferase involved in cell wall biosynthesis